MKRIRSLMLGMIAAVLAGASFGSTAFAELLTNSLTVTPPYQRIVLVPGETYNGSIKISSQASSNSNTAYEITVGPFSEVGGEGAKDDYGQVNFVDSSTYNQIVDWIEIEQPTGVISPNEARAVPFKINVPEDAPAGGQYASLIVKDSAPIESSDQEGLAVDNVMQILSIIYAEVAGETRQEGEIIENTVPSFMFNGPLTAESMVRNNGNVHTRAQYTLQIWPMFGGEEICTNEESPEMSLVLPETERYHAQNCDLPSIGIFKAKQVVKIFGEESTVEKMVVICPLWLLFVIILVIVALIIWIVMRIRARKKDSKAESKTD